MLEARNISFGYENKPVIAGLSIEVAPGSIIGLQGYSGAGKSTLAKLLTGHLRPQDGEITVDGEPLARRGYTPVQLIQQHPERAIDPLWRLNRVVPGISAETLADMGVDHTWLERFPLEVSGGQLQRINIARALDERTRYLVADEITTMMDALLQVDIWTGLVKQVHKRNLGMLVISHDGALLRHVCDTVYSFEEIAGETRQ